MAGGGDVTVWPQTATRAADGSLAIGGVPLVELAQEYGTPLYVYDVATIRGQCRRYQAALERAHPRGRVAYAGKAGMNRALLHLLRDEGLSLDVVSGGELAYALACGFPPERIHLHGNNKTPDELVMALAAGIDAIVVDNHDEVELLARLTEGRAAPAGALLRVNPGIDVHTHDYRKTGILDSKFGLAIETGDAERAVTRLLELPGVRLRGYHAHVGSQIFEPEPFVATVDALFAFAAAMRERYGIVPEEVSPGGGFGVAYLPSDPAEEPDAYAAAVGRAAVAAAERYDLPDPVLTIEPGRGIVGQAGVAVYTLGARKVVPGIRQYVSVDGGMADNIRPALYGAAYTAELVARPAGGETSTWTIAGKYCESGDVLIREVQLPPFEPGDLLAVPVTGAYCLAMASNYNLALRPAVVFVEEGRSWLVQRRESYNDLFFRDVVEAPGSVARAARP